MQVDSISRTNPPMTFSQYEFLCSADFNQGCDRGMTKSILNA